MTATMHPEEGSNGIHVEVELAGQGVLRRALFSPGPAKVQNWKKEVKNLCWRAGFL